MKLSQRIAISYIRTKFKLLSTISKKKAATAAFTLFCTPQRKHQKPLPGVFKQSEKLKLSLDGIPIVGWRWNHPGAKKVLILHGFESTVANFDRYVKFLIKKGYEVLAFDAPAHGQSGGKKINAPLYKRMIMEIHKKYGPINSFMAHSFGGLALSLALEEIPHGSDISMVLVAPATETTTAIDAFFRFLRLDPTIRPLFNKVIMDQGAKPPEWYSIRRAMKHIKASVLWLHDIDDDTTPLTDVKKVEAENYKNIRFVYTKGLGHRRIYRDNEVTKKIIEFL